MVNLKPLATAWFTGCVLLLGGALQVRADPVLAVIDIRPIIARHDIGNALGLAFNPDANVFYLAHGSDDRGGVIYTLDIHGNLLRELNFQGTVGGYPTSLSYDRSTGHLFVLASEVRLVEIDPETAQIFSELPITDIDGGGFLRVRDDGIWQPRFSEDVIRHYTRDGAFIEDLSVAASFPGFPGPFALASSFTAGGFFVVDTFDRRIVEVDSAGHEVAAAATNLGDGRGLAIDSDLDSQRIFLEVNSQDIFVLSSEFIGEPEIVSIEIRPHGPLNRINPRSKGKVPVAILTTDSFDATSVDPAKVLFGATGTEAAPTHFALRDVDRDGNTDIVLQFKIQETGIQCADTSAVLSGETFDGRAIKGSDSIRTVGCK
ncbi:MAG TPA: hypothetical protein VKB41_07145 [Steroidobacteraceae bacterium]|nr:hypothetical protein [Steroidobacteraceae bacterium]